jgi:catechol 2,3-dioxygenase-like lactoylglutathione lyase family enzyme
MIDHISIGVRDLAASAKFYDAALAPLGYAQTIVRETTIGYGKQYPDFWLNERRAMAPVDPNTGTHICLRASSPEAVKAFYDAAMSAGRHRMARLVRVRNTPRVTSRPLFAIWTATRSKR